ncbi:MAG TPA: carboxypeptidase-like regulatory domain-containing protein, partial [Blastocatellia bacterium]|nr:carboxypeptidase-like regulatory domain-containing protein [Blastocatellia bacterium]
GLKEWRFGNYNRQEETEVNIRQCIWGAFALCVVPTVVCAQNISGKVVDADNNGIVGVIVRLRDKDTKDILRKATTIAGGEYSIPIPSGTAARVYHLFAAKAGYKPVTRPVSVPADTPNIGGQEIHLEKVDSVEFTRTIVGFEQAGATGAESEQHFFFDLHIEVPLGSRDKPDDSLGPRWRNWGTIRVTTVPQEINSGVADFVTEFPTEVGKVKVSEIADAAEVLAGLEFRLLESNKKARDTGKQDIVSLSLLGGLGLTTPFSLRTATARNVFEATDEARQRFNLSPDKKFIAFVPQERDRFFRQYYAGLRLKTRYFEDGQDTGRNPAMLDLLWGFNEAITGGRLHGSILRIEGFYALPILDNTVYLFGTAMVKPVRAQFADPLVLKRAAGQAVPDPTVGIVSVPAPDRDYYRIGVGVDLSTLIGKWKGSREQAKVAKQTEKLSKEADEANKKK